MKKRESLKTVMLSKSLIFPVGMWIVLAFVCGYMVATYFNWEHVKSMYTSGNVKQIKQMKPTSIASAVPVIKPQFEFYTLLTQQEPMLPEQKVPEITEQKIAVTRSVVKTEQFMVQLAAFNSPSEAERMRAMLALKGVYTRVIASEQDKHQWYRVILGPFGNRDEAVTAQNAIIKKEGIRGMIRKA